MWFYPYQTNSYEFTALFYFYPWVQFGGGHDRCVPLLFQTVGIYHIMCPPIFLIRFCMWRGFKNKSDVSCEELFMLDITHSQVDVETESTVVWYY